MKLSEQQTMDKLWLIHRIDCEATQATIQNAALGRRATAGFAEVLEAHGLRGSFFTIPSEARAHPDLYGRLGEKGHEVGLHVHPADHGHEEFLGVYGPEDQREILGQATDLFEQALGFRPQGICIGYGSSNDFTRGIVHELGYRHGITMVTGRILPECASVAAGAPLEPHYAHRYNRVLEGDLDFVEIPQTIDPDSRMWGGKHPQDLRIELVDAKNHYYVIEKAIRRQVDQRTPLNVLSSNTHNIFAFDEPGDFRRQTLEGVLHHELALAERYGLEPASATTADLAQTYRETVPLEARSEPLTLDRRAYAANA